VDQGFSSGEQGDRPEIRLSRQSAIHVGGRIVALRAERGWNRARLARELGVRWNSLKKLEEGSSLPSLGMLLGLVRVLDLNSIEEVLGEGRIGTRVLLDLEELAHAKATVRPPAGA
jgi:DNA-binding XRE family transcriptional regulator